MTAARLRKAAKVLRERAEAAYTPEAMHPWGDKTLAPLPREEWPSEVRGYLGGEWGEYCATMHPGVGLLIADWLNNNALRWEFSDVYTGENASGEALADLILGGETQ